MRKNVKKRKIHCHQVWWNNPLTFHQSKRKTKRVLPAVTECNRNRGNVLVTPPLQPTPHLPFSDYIHKHIKDWTRVQNCIHFCRSQGKGKSNNHMNGSQPIFRSASRGLKFIWEIKDAYSSTTTSIPAQSCWISSFLSKPASPPGPLRPGAISRTNYGHCAACSFCDRRSTDWSSARLPGLLHLYHAVLLFTSGHWCADLLHLCKYNSPCAFLLFNIYTH